MPYSEKARRAMEAEWFSKNGHRTSGGFIQRSWKKSEYSKCPIINFRTEKYDGTTEEREAIRFQYAQKKRKQSKKKGVAFKDSASRVKLSYSDFLKTQYWRVVKCKVRAYKQNTCEGCGKEGTKESPLHVHHPNYDFVRFELESNRWRELKLLCANCHEKEHGINPDKHDDLRLVRLHAAPDTCVGEDRQTRDGRGNCNQQGL